MIKRSCDAAMDVCLGDLGLPAESLDATLAFVHFPGIDYQPWVGLFGDGVIASIWDDGEIEMDRVNWSGEAPGYPRYLLDQHLSDRFASMFDDGPNPSEAMSIERILPYRYQEGKTRFVHHKSAQRGLYGLYGPQNGKIVAVLSDGICSIPGIPWEQAVRELLTFRGPLTGQFIQRRLRAQLATWAKAGTGPTDDISIAALARIDD